MTSELRTSVTALLGDDYGHLAVVDAESVDRFVVSGGMVSDLRLKLSDETVVPAYWAEPDDVPPGPAVLYCHAHSDLYEVGRAELIDGIQEMQPGYLAALLRLGYRVLCLEMPTFGERRAPREGALSKALHWRGRTLFGRMLAELKAGLDYLAARDDVDGARIATVGFSMGGTHSWWLGALEPKVAAVVQMCCFADLDMLIDSGAHDGHGHYMTVPGLLKVTSTGRLCARCAPRPMFIGAGFKDWSTPRAAFDHAVSQVRAAYADHGRSGRLIVRTADRPGHEETPEMRRAALAFLEKALA